VKGELTIDLTASGGFAPRLESFYDPKRERFLNYTVLASAPKPAARR